MTSPRRTFLDAVPEQDPAVQDDEEPRVLAPGIFPTDEQQKQLRDYADTMRQPNYKGPKKVYALFEGSTPQGIMAMYEGRATDVIRFSLSAPRRPVTPTSPGPLEDIVDDTEAYPEFGALPPHVPRFAEHSQTPLRAAAETDEQCRSFDFAAHWDRLHGLLDAALSPPQPGVAAHSDGDGGASDEERRSSRV